MIFHTGAVQGFFGGGGFVYFLILLVCKHIAAFRIASNWEIVYFGDYYGRGWNLGKPPTTPGASIFNKGPSFQIWSLVGQKFVRVCLPVIPRELNAPSQSRPTLKAFANVRAFSHRGKNNYQNSRTNSLAVEATTPPPAYHWWTRGTKSHLFCDVRFLCVLAITTEI